MIYGVILVCTIIVYYCNYSMDSITKIIIEYNKQKHIIITL